LQNAVQIWKTRSRFAKRRANLENAQQICKTPCKFGKRAADLQSAVQIWKTRSRFAEFPIVFDSFERILIPIFVQTISEGSETYESCRP
jgi:hypothetical protein